MKNLILIFACIFFFSCSENKKKSKDIVSESTELGYINLSVPDFEKKYKELPDAVLLDIRTPKEVEKGAIAGSITIDFYENFESKIQSLDKSKPYFVYCAAGARSAKACKLMKEKGFVNVYNLEKGYSGWMESRH